MLPTPDTSHLTKEDLEHVYDPAEDTFILLDALEADQDVLCAMKPNICLEIGSGSGCVSAFLAKMLGTSAVYLCTDINERAAIATHKTGIQNTVSLSPVLTSLHSPFLPRLKHAINVLIFNPPYVPTEDEEAQQGQLDANISAAWAGGLEGMTSTRRLLEAVPDLLAPNGRFYLVAIQQNKPAAIIARMQSLGIDGKIVLKRRAGGEVLYVLLFTRIKTPG